MRRRKFFSAVAAAFAWPWAKRVESAIPRPEATVRVFGYTGPSWGESDPMSVKEAKQWMADSVSIMRDVMGKAKVYDPVTVDISGIRRDYLHPPAQDVPGSKRVNLEDK